MIEVEPYIEKEGSLLREAQEAYKKEEKKYQRLRKKRAELQKNFDQINVKIKKEIEEEKEYQRLHKKRAEFQKKLNQINVEIKIKKEILDKKRIELEKARKRLDYAYPYISKRK